MFARQLWGISLEISLIAMLKIAGKEAACAFSPRNRILKCLYMTFGRGHEASRMYHKPTSHLNYVKIAS